MTNDERHKSDERRDLLQIKKKKKKKMLPNLMNDGSKQPQEQDNYSISSAEKSGVLAWSFLWGTPFFVKNRTTIISVPLLILYFELRHLTMLFAILIPLALLTTLTHASPPLPSPNQLRLMQNVGLAQFSRFNLFLDPNTAAIDTY